MQRGSRIHSLEVLRGMAALAVAWFHISAGPESEFLFETTGKYGYIGVDIFFIISGYVIPLSLFYGYSNYGLSNFPKFIVRRLVRLEPPYFLSIAISIICLYGLYFLGEAFVEGFQGSYPDISVEQVLFHVFYLIPITQYDWIQVVYWTLAWEFVFYISIGILYPFLVGNNGRLFIVVITFFLIFLVYFDILDARLLSFLIGFCLFFIQNVHKKKISIYVGIMTICMVLVFISDKPAFFGIFITAFIIIFFQSRKPLNGYAWKWALFLGSCSYSLYLVHWPVAGVIKVVGYRVIPEQFPDFVVPLIAMSGSMVAAIVFRYTIEERAIRWASKIART